MTFHNCDANPNSYMALFPNFDDLNSNGALSGILFEFCVNIFNSMQMKPSGTIMPQEYFMFLETHWGGCGCYAETDGRDSVAETLDVAIGFR